MRRDEHQTLKVEKIDGDGLIKVKLKKKTKTEDKETGTTGSVKPREDTVHLTGESQKQVGVACNEAKHARRTVFLKTREDSKTGWGWRRESGFGLRFLQRKEHFYKMFTSLSCKSSGKWAFLHVRVGARITGWPRDLTCLKRDTKSETSKEIYMCYSRWC